MTTGLRLTKSQQAAISRALAQGDLTAEPLAFDEHKPTTTRTRIPIRRCAHCGGEVRTTPTGDSFVCDGREWWHFDCKIF